MELPTIKYNDKEYKDLTKKERVDFKDFFVGLMKIKGFITDGEAKKIRGRLRKYWEAK
jgi:hypothetical protein